MDYIAEATRLVKHLDQRMGPSPYDIAWVARLRAPDGDGPLWPDLIEWLMENQRADGSWGGEVEYYHDRIICTLAALIAVRENGNTRQIKDALRRGERYLWHHLHLLRQDPFELVGFELLFPTLLSQAQMLGLDVPTHTYGYGDIQTAKLRLIPSEMLYSPRISTVHSLEFLGSSGNVRKIEQALNSIGSIGNSPAATAYYLSLDQGDQRALGYLEAVRAHMEHIIYLYPFRTFELSWVLNNLTFSGLPITGLVDEDALEVLLSALGANGAGLDPAFGIPDGDITSVCFKVLLEAGYDPDPLILAEYEDDEERIFKTYEYERNMSVSTNAHALEALQLMPDYPNRREVRDQIVRVLLDNRTYDTFWTDKWHASPYYATSHALVALMKEGSYIAHACRHTVDWLTHTQRDDGSWGFFHTGTAEETAYALTALLHYRQHGSVDEDAVHRGAGYLERVYHESDSPYPEFWIGKDLFAPYDVIRSTVLAALILYQQVFGGL